MVRIVYRQIGVFALMVVLLSSGYAVWGAEEGKKAPDFVLRNLEGREVKLSDYAGKVVILDFWATWCPPCRAEIPHFVQLQKEWGSKGLQVIGVSLDREGVKVLKPFAKKYRMNYLVLIGDSKVVKVYGSIRSIPTTFVIDRNGIIYKKYVGY